MEKEKIQAMIEETEAKMKAIKDEFDKFNQHIEETGIFFATLLRELIKERDSWMEKLKN